jgi:long-chain acyl-CoA synthetase
MTATPSTPTATLDETTRLRLLTAPDGAFPLTEIVVDGQRLEMFDRDPRTMRDAFLATAAHADLTAIVYGEERWTYRDQWDEVVALAHGLRDELGVRKGDRVGLAMRNYPEFIFTFWATQLIGAVLVPYNGWLRTRELADLIEGSAPVVLVADQERIALLAEEELAAGGVRAVVGVRCEETPASRTPVTQYAGLLTRAGHGRTSPAVPPAAEVLPEDPATILYTSGTTGRPKGALHRHRNHSASLLNKLIRAMRVVPATGTEPAQVLPPAPSVKLMTFPMFHIAGMNTLYTAAYSGHTLVLMYKWNAELAVDLVEREGANELSGPPFVIQTFLDAATPDRDLSSLRMIGMGGSAASIQVVEAMKARFGDQVTPRTGYGLTETTSGVLSIPPTDFARHPDSVGRPLPTAHVAILGEDDSELPQGEVGEIAIRGPQVVSGYVDVPDADDFRNGWFHTGDLGRIDEEGLVYIVGRLKDVVIRGGENIYCAEVEAALTSHPDVLEAAAFGAPHPALGEELVAVARVRPHSDLTADRLRAFTAEHLAAFKVPARIALAEVELPRTPSGKIVKREIASVLGVEDLLAPAAG